MMALAPSAIRLEGPRQAATSFAHDVIAGLTATPKRLPPKYFYDEAGSRLFEQIAKLPQYYPTRTELQILAARAGDIARYVPPASTLVEFGSGSTAKARLLLREMPGVRAYVPVDISAEFMNGEAEQLQRDVPGLLVVPVVADFTGPFALPATVGAGPRLGFFPGSTIGNFEPHEAVEFLRRARHVLGPGATFIVGVDLVKNPEVLFDAYNDSQGITARFNRNLLARINRELGADFDLCAFEHHAFYNREQHRIEMHLASLRRQKVRVLGKSFKFYAGETIHTENSYKYTIEAFAALAGGADWRVAAVWTDPERYFSVQALAPEERSRVT